MKTLRTIYTLLILATASVVVAAQDTPDEYLGLPGDNLNLYAVMNLFQESETLEGFERSLNDNESMINNLDLNGDNLIDYITVSDYEEGNVHTIVLRAALNKNEQQDIAVFVVEKLRNGAVQIQLIGDEALYGPNYIVEPIYAETPNPGYTGNVYRGNVNVVTTSYYDIATWPLITFIYRPGYVVWRSSWYWGYYPRYWSPWRPHYWHYYYGYHYHWHDYYYSHYHHWNHFRSGYYASYYRPRVRVYSPTVAVNINNGRYRNTYSHPDQRRAGEEYYTRDVRNGLSQKYYSDSTLAEKVTWDNGNRTGEWLQYYPDGTVCLRAEYIAGKLEGLFSYYHPNGNLYYEGNYKNDFRTGDWMVFNYDGSLKQIIAYEEGKPSDPKLADQETEFLDQLEKNRDKIEIVDITGTTIK